MGNVFRPSQAKGSGHKPGLATRDLIPPQAHKDLPAGSERLAPPLSHAHPSNKLSLQVIPTTPLAPPLQVACCSEILYPTCEPGVTVLSGEGWNVEREGLGGGEEGPQEKQLH